MAAAGRIGAIDGLRAIAMTMVVLQHCGLMPFGWMGVWLFYVISGFVVCSTFHSRASRETGPYASTVADFMKRRAVRIWPVYFLYIAACAIFLVLTNAIFNGADLVTMAGFIYNWQMIFQFAGPLSDWPAFQHLWTISVEQQFYLLFPFIYFAFMRNGAASVAGMAVLMIAAPVIRYVLGAAVLSSGAEPGAASFSVYASSIGHIDAFLAGCFLARWRGWFETSRWAERTLWTVAWAVSAAYLGVQIWINAQFEQRSGIDLVKDIISGGPYGYLREVFMYYLPVLAGAALIGSIIKGRRFVAPLAIPAVRWIGEISYGAYVYHAAVLLFVETVLVPRGGRVTQKLILFALTYAITLAVAAISYYGFETPVRRLFSGRKSAPAAASRSPAE